MSRRILVRSRGRPSATCAARAVFSDASSSGSKVVPHQGPLTMKLERDATRQKDALLSGGFGKSTNSARAGFLPICLERVPIAAFQGIPVYLRTIKGKSGEDDSTKEAFTLYSTEAVSFSEQHRERLVGHGVKFVYIP